MALHDELSAALARLSIAQAALGIFGLLVLYIFCFVFYRVYLHPLAKYPGPFLAKITDAHQLYYAWTGDRHLQFWRMHEKYGKVVRFGPNSLTFNSRTALKEIYGFKSNVRKAEFYDAFVHPAANTHNTRDKAVHARKRRVMSQSFSDSAMKEMERYILANVRTFCEQIGLSASADSKGWTAPKAMSDWFNYLAFDILGDLAFGKAFQMLEKPDNRYALDLVSLATTRHSLCGTMPLVGKTGFDKILFPQIAAGRAKYMQYSKAQLTERTQLGDDTDRRDFFYHLLNARDPETGQGFTTQELWGESNLLIIAGSDTTSTAMAATLFYLCRYPHALAKVTKEIREKFDDVEQIQQGPKLASCTYLRACIDEAMRMSPSVGGIVPREVLPGGMLIDGKQIPASTIVGVPHYTIHHNDEYFPDSFTFAPERWIAGSQITSSGRGAVTEADVSVASSAFCPFSIGPRGCIGKGLAYIEMTTTLARMLYLYDVRKSTTAEFDPAQGDPKFPYGRHRPNELQLYDQFTSRKDGLMVEFRRRD